MTAQRARERWRSRIVGHGDESPDQLLANPLNFRIHPKPQQEALAGVLDQVGWVQDVIVNRTTGHVVDGHLRVSLALGRGESSVPVVYVELDDHEEKLILATIDPIAAMAATDAEKLDELLRDVAADSTAVQAMLSDLAESAGILSDKPPVADDPGAQIDRAEELRQKWGTERGQLWEIGRHRLLCGDSTSVEDVARLMGEDKADCVFTSPPYAVGIDYGIYQDTIENLRSMLPTLARLWRSMLAPGGFAVVNFNDIASGGSIAGSEGPCEYPMALEYWPIFRGAGFVLWSRRIWCKPTARVNSPWCIQSNRGASDWEHVWTWKAPGEAFMRQTSGEYASQKGWFDTSSEVGVEIGKDTHGAGMATSAAARMIAVHSRAQHVVHEPFTGTGTTLVAAEQTGRACYGMEIEPKYVAVALERLSGMGLEPKLADG